MDDAGRMAPRLLPLGTGSILMGSGRSAAGYLLETDGMRLLVDIGPGTLLRLSEAGVPRESIDHVLLSHFHPDHHADLLGLLFLRRNPDFPAPLRPLRIVAPPGIRRILAAWRECYGTWVQHPETEVLEIGEGATWLGRLRLTAFAAQHAVPSYCYRFELPEGATLAYSGDSELCEGLVAACRGVDLCWLECSFPDDLATAGHLCPSRVRELLRVATPRTAALTHFYPAMESLAADARGWAALWSGLATEVIALRDLEEVAL